MKNWIRGIAREAMEAAMSQAYTGDASVMAFAVAVRAWHGLKSKFRQNPKPAAMTAKEN